MNARASIDFSHLPDPALELVASCFQALSDPTRLKILRALRSGERTVQDLVSLFSWTQPNISRHLSILARAGMVKKTKHGQFVTYSIANSRIYLLCDNVCAHLGELLATYSETR